MSSDLQAAIEAIIYAAEEPATTQQIAAALHQTSDTVSAALEALMARYASDDYGIEIKAVAGGYRMATKPQTHEAVRAFIKSTKPPLRLSLPALETLAVIAYRQPVTAPEIKDIRGVDPAGVLNTLLEKRLITTGGRKDVVGKPILYKTTRDFLIRFGLNSIDDLPTLKEFEELTRAGLDGIDLRPESDAVSESAEIQLETPTLEASEAPADVEPDTADPKPSDEQPIVPEPADSTGVDASVETDLPAAAGQ
jgi:segregation and condensation protein B